MPDPQSATDTPDVRTQLRLLVPALAIGILSALVLWGLDEAAYGLQLLLWEALPQGLGIEPDNPVLIIGILTLTGLAVGLIAQFLPGHAGPDSATTELDSPPPPLMAVPSILLAVMISLAGGVSLGPENPIIAVNGALAVAIFARLLPGLPKSLPVTLAVAATLGALFGTPIAAALILTSALATSGRGGSLWDRLFLPVASAAAGTMTMRLLGAPPLGFTTATYPGPQAIDLLTGFAIAAASAALGILAGVVFPWVHRAFHAMRHPVLFTTAGGLVLGILGAIGGPLTLFKGLEESAEIIANTGEYTAAALLAMVGIKLVALLVSASAGFRGGRIFPAVFIGIAFGLAVHSLFPAIPAALAVACGGMGIVLQTMRDGWIALFIGVALTGQIALLPVLCVIVLPTWLIVTRAPKLEIHVPHPPRGAADS